MNKVIHGDSLDVLKSLPDESVDLVCTDPPYAISFMGKSWDKALPDIGIFKETLRVLKPGAFAFVMSAPRSDVCSRMAILLEDAGFNIAFTPIYWTYASGFPKAMNIGKMVDKRGGVLLGRDFCALIKQKREEMGLTKTQLAALGGFHGEINHGGSVSNWEEGKGCPTPEQYNKLIEILGLEGNPIVEAQREVIGKSSHKSGIANKTEGHYTVGGTVAVAQDITVPATDAAKALDGSYGGFQPKPAVEVIIVAMKPLSEKTYVDQALKNGKGITWLDDCRIGTEQRTTGFMAKGSVEAFNRDDNWQPKDGKTTAIGRFPANLIVSDDVLNDGRTYKSTGGKGDKSGNPAQSVYGKYGHQISGSAGGFGDSGSYSRFFSLDAWYKERVSGDDVPAHSPNGAEGVRFPLPALSTLPFLADKLAEIESKAYNRETCQVDGDPGYKRKPSPVDSAEKKSPTTKVTEKDRLGGSAADPATPSTDSAGQNPSVESVATSVSPSGTNTAPNPVQIRLDTETLTEILSMCVSELATVTTQKHSTESGQPSAKSASSTIQSLNDITQTCLSLLKSSGSVSPAIGRQKQQERDTDLLLKNLGNLPESVRNTFPFLVCAKASKSEKNAGLEHMEERPAGGMVGRGGSPENRNGMFKDRTTAMQNVHPTVKPLKLMSYLITLGSRPGDVVLDPFAGSFTTCIAAKQLGRDFIGIEREEEYCEIGNARLAAIAPTLL